MSPARDAGNAEVIAHDGDARLAHSPNHRRQALHFFFPFRTIEQNVIPVRRVKIFNRPQFQPSGLGGFSQSDQLLQTRHFFAVARKTPSRARVHWLVPVESGALPLK